METEEQAFITLKKKLMTAPVLVYPDPKRPFFLDTDASDMGIRAVLSQVLNGEERATAYSSRTPSKGEKHYCITRLELFVVVHFSK